MNWMFRAEKAKVRVDLVYVYISDFYITRSLISRTSWSLNEGITWYSKRGNVEDIKGNLHSFNKWN